MSQQVVILHGWQNRRPDGHWQKWLAAELEARGAEVRYPQLPDPDAPVPGEWLAALEAQLAGFQPERLTVIAHSLGCLLWLDHLRERARRGERGLAAARVVLVAPPAPEVLAAVPEIAAFAIDPDEELASLVAAATGELLVVAGDIDEYCPRGAGPSFAEPLGAALLTVEGGGHLTIDDGFGPFPLVLELVDGVRRAA